MHACYHVINKGRDSPKAAALKGWIEMNETLQYLLGETKIEADGGYYVLDVQDEGDAIHVTVDYERTEATEDLSPIGRNCVFNETYSADEKNPFSFEKLSADLHAQRLHEVDQWVADFVAEKTNG